jgi:hypothetical protein
VKTGEVGVPPAVETRTNGQTRDGWPRARFRVRRMERERVKEGRSGGALGGFSDDTERKMGKRWGPTRRTEEEDEGGSDWWRARATHGASRGGMGRRQVGPRHCAGF